MNKIFFMLLSLAMVTAPRLIAQQTVSAQTALLNIESRLGADAVKWIAELKAVGGMPQPMQWDVLAYNPSSTGLLHHFRASAGVVQDGGPDSRRYPNDVPNGFFTLADLSLDSVAAFTVAEAEARKAQQGFDSCDYFLTLKEFSREPIWRLELVDATHRLVGSVYISGSNGQVYRTVWVQRDAISGYPNIMDSLAPASLLNFSNNDLQPLPGNNGFGGIPAPSGQILSPVPPDTNVMAPPGITVTPVPSPAPPRTGSIFKEFPVAGGGRSRPIDKPLTVPNEPASAMPIPEPDPLLTPVDPVVTGRVPPINVPGTGGSSTRIPPPPLPQ